MAEAQPDAAGARRRRVIAGYAAPRSHSGSRDADDPTGTEVDPISEKLFDVDPELVRRFAADQIPSPATFHAAISREDEMLLHALEGYHGDLERASVLYLLQGKQMMDQLRQIVAWAFGGWDRVSSFLDFACGYGRFTRHLAQELAPARIWVSDIYTDAVHFQREQFGVHGVTSATTPDALSLDRRFDVIFASSLFSHLPRRTFEPWLAKLSSLLTERGVLVFTTHGVDLSGRTGEHFLFEACSESRTLDANDYGTTFVSERFVADAIRRATGGRAPWRRIAHGHLGFQDLYVVSRDPGRDPRTLAYDIGCFGHVDGCSMDHARSLRLGGWAADLGSEDGSARVRVMAGGKILHECAPDHDRPVVATLLSAKALRSGWWCSFPATEIEPSDWIAVKVVNWAGRENTISLAPLESMLRW